MSWTPERQATLERYAAAGKSAADAAKVLNCSRDAVLGRAYRTGVKFCGPQVSPGGTPGRTRWRDEEIDTLRAWAPFGAKAVADRVGRPLESVFKKAAKIGLRFRARA